MKRAVVAQSSRLRLTLASAFLCACSGSASSGADAVTANDGVGAVEGSPNRRPSEDEGRQEADTSDAAVDAFDEAMRLGDSALYSGNYEAARLSFLRAMELRDDSMSPALGAIRSMVIEGQAEARTQIAERIRKKVKQLLDNEATAGSGWLLAARLALAERDAGAALDAAHLAVQELPEMGVSWRVLGESAMAAEHWGEAVDALQMAVALGLEAEAGTWERLADAQDELGDLEAAEKSARQAVEMTGSDPHARRRRLNLLAAILKHRMNLEDAQKVAEQARALGPNDPAVLHNLGAIAEAKNQPDVALAFYQQAVAVVPVPMTLWRLGRLQLELDRPQDALLSFKKAAGNLSRWSWPLTDRWLPAYEVGKLYGRAELWPDAIGWFEDALREARTADAIREVQSWLAYARLQ